MLDRIVRPAEAETLTGYCDVHLRRLEDRGEFPKRFKLAENSGPYGAVGFLLSDIQAWMERRAAAKPWINRRDQSRATPVAPDSFPEEATPELEPPPLPAGTE